MAYQPVLIEGEVLAQARTYTGPADATVGIRGTHGAAIGFSDAILGRHVLFLGGIGTGKTVGMSSLVDSIRADSRENDVFLFFDTKGDYIARFYEEGDVSLSPDPYSHFPGARTWNLFAEIEDVPSRDLSEVVRELTQSLMGQREDDPNRIWVAMASDLVAALITAYARTRKPYTNVDLRAIADSVTVQQIRAILDRHPDLRGAAQYIAKDGSNTTTSVMIFVQQMLREVFAGAFRQVGDFSARHFVRDNNGRALFLEYDVSRGATATPVFRTILDLALKEALGRGRGDGRVIVVLDEFSLLPRVAHLDPGLNFGRSLGLRFIVGTQNVGQVMHAYGAQQGASILSGFGTVFAFRMFDEPSRTFVRQRFGANRKIVHYDGALKSRGVGEQVLEGSVIEDWDLSGLNVGEAVVGLPTGPPLLFSFAPLNGAS
ncbi:MAG: hypothetical protein QOF53_2381 [Nocardioidaceae bacterium]|nr:hypothetical protein [Nocardioidaceae bacterium]